MLRLLAAFTLGIVVGALLGGFVVHVQRPPQSFKEQLEEAFLKSVFQAGEPLAKPTKPKQPKNMKLQTDEPVP